MRVVVELKLYKIISDEYKPSVLQEVSLPIITNEECMGMYWGAGHIEHITNNMICAGYKKGGKAACQVRCL